MWTLLDKSVRVQTSDTDAGFGPCPNSVYLAWIKRVHDNGTHVNAGDTFVWLYVQMLPPKLVNCLIIVRNGDEYPPVVTSGILHEGNDPLVD